MFLDSRLRPALLRPEPFLSQSPESSALSVTSSSQIRGVLRQLSSLQGPKLFERSPYKMFNGSLVPPPNQQGQLPPMADLQNGMNSPGSGDDAQKAAHLANVMGEPQKNESRPQATFLTKLYA